jgi:hypothetical protein
VGECLCALCVCAAGCILQQPVSFLRLSVHLLQIRVPTPAPPEQQDGPERIFIKTKSRSVPVLFVWLATRSWHGSTAINIAINIMLCIASPRLSSSTPGVFYAYFYNHAHRLRLEKLIYLDLSRSSNGFKPLLEPGGGFRSEMAVT